jgi:ParB-like chromosome segregation protein Spo0J
MLVRELRANPDNPRIIRDDKFKKLVQSLRDFPQMLELRPIVVNAQHVVLGGNMRLKACEAAGLQEVPVIIADALTAQQEREFIVKDNASFGEWDWDVLANEWDAEPLAEWGIDVPWVGNEIPLPELDATEERSLEQMTFTLSLDQADTIREALAAAKAAGPFIDTGNENSNGNALARIAELSLNALR